MRSENNYGYQGRLTSIRKLYKGLPRAYLDNAASPLILSCLPYKAADLLVNAPPAVSPHSTGPLGDQTTKIIDDVRSEVLELLHVNASSHEVVFCSNATGAAKLVGESLYASHLVYSVDSHTSIVGLRTLAKTWATFTGEPSAQPKSVFSWPLQSNFDGTRYPGLEWTQLVHEKGGLVLLDIASFAATEMPDLQKIDCDFAILSFYKIFGFPDLGALIIKKSPQTREFLGRKRYFGGGTVAALAPSSSWMARSSDDRMSTWLEDGTLPFHSIISLKAAFIEFRRIFGQNFMEGIHLHTQAVADYCRDKLTKHDQCRVYGSSSNSGPIVTFALKSVGHHEFSVAAALRDVHVRAGTLCNIGAFTLQSEMTDAKILHNYNTLGKRCNDEISYIDGDPTGVIRVSFGSYSSFSDVDALLDVVNEVAPAKNSHDVNENQLKINASGNGASSVANHLHGNTVTEESVVVQDLYTYPIKSCSGLRVEHTLLTPTGLEYDRTFCIVDVVSKRVLSMKKHKNMVFLKPSVEDQFLVVQHNPSHGQKNSILRIPLNSSSWRKSLDYDNLVLNTEDEVVGFFSRAIGVNCTIAKSLDTMESSDSSGSLDTNQRSASFANSSPLLVVTTASGADIDLQDLTVFRPNIVLKTSQAWREDQWTRLLFKDTEHSGEISLLGKCRRCNMICIKGDGTVESFPYMQLCKHRKQGGRIYFGQHATLENSLQSMPLKVGDVFTAKG